VIEDVWSSPLLSVKQAIPAVRDGIVPRDRLEGRLATATAKLTAVIAPAGWGKTSLVSRWAQTAAIDAPVAWVSLDETDDDPIRFWTYALTSLRRASDQVSSASVDALRASTDAPAFQALPILLNELAESTTRHVLVFDDFHVITHREVHESVEFLLAYLPPALRVVIASRWDPPLPLARMRVRGELSEIRADDLRFSLDETAALVAGVSAGELDPTVTRAVWEQTEGWAAGLQLAGIALRDSAGTQIGGDSQHLFDYFATEVFPALAPSQRDLLARAAPLELLSGPLCDAALDVKGSVDVLDELERADLFVIALDHDRQWYRCHPLLRDALLRTADRQPAHTDVLRRAARWFQERDRLDDAVRHMLSAGDAEAAELLLRSNQAWFLQRGWATTYLALGERLPETIVHPNLALSMAYTAEFSGQGERAVPWLDICDRRIDDEIVVDYWRSPRAAALALRGVVGVPAFDTSRSIALCQQAVELEAAAGSGDHPLALSALGRAYGLDGQFDEAVRILTGLWQRRDDVDWWIGVDLQVASLIVLFMLPLGRDQELDRFLIEVGPATDVAEREWGIAGALATTLLRLVEGRRSHQLGQSARARAQLTHGLGLADKANRPLFLVIGLVFLAELELACGSRAAAHDAVLRAREIVDNDPIAPFAMTWLENAEIAVGRVAVRAATGTGALVEGLTDREMSILRMLPGSATQREIGSALYLSINTVKAYNKSIYRKLGVATRHDAVQTARRHGLI
jgi:LuxR family transcriptional regulator, maltose regulon positive regulatory protein